MISIDDLMKSITIIAPYTIAYGAGVDGKICVRCETYKLITEFGRGYNRKEGFNERCKLCTKTLQAEARARCRHKALARNQRMESKS